MKNNFPAEYKIFRFIGLAMDGNPINVKIFREKDSMTTPEQWAKWGEEQKYYSYIVESVFKPEMRFTKYFWQLILTEPDKDKAKEWVVTRGIPCWIIRTWVPFDSLCDGNYLKRQFAAFWHPKQANDGWAYGFMQGGSLWREQK